MSICKICGSIGVDTHDGICQPCRCVEAVKREENRINEENMLPDELSSPKTMGMEGFTEIAQAMKRWRGDNQGNDK